jgi:uroporphyrinogen-III synthase
MSALAGKVVAVTRAPAQAEATCAELVRRGATPLRLPTIDVAPLADLGPLARALSSSGAGWLLLTSKNAVASLAQLLNQRPELADAVRARQVAVVGPATAEAFVALGCGGAGGRRIGFDSPRVAAEHRAEGLLDTLPAALAGVSVLIPGARKMRPVLADGLRARGAEVEHVVVYDNLLPPPAAWQPGVDELRAGRVDAVLLTSGSTATNLRQILGDEAKELLATVVIAAIGPLTEEAACAADLRVDLVASPYTMPALLDALERHFASQPAPKPRAAAER